MVNKPAIENALKTIFPDLPKGVQNLMQPLLDALTFILPRLPKGVQKRIQNRLLGYTLHGIPKSERQSEGTAGHWISGWYSGTRLPYQRGIA